jgi:hypothetical protein
MGFCASNLMERKITTTKKIVICIPFFPMVGLGDIGQWVSRCNYEGSGISRLLSMSSFFFLRPKYGLKWALVMCLTPRVHFSNLQQSLLHCQEDFENPTLAPPGSLVFKSLLPTMGG